MCEHFNVRRIVPDSYVYGDPELRRRILSGEFDSTPDRAPPPRLLSPDFSLVKWPAMRARRRLKTTKMSWKADTGLQKSLVPSIRKRKGHRQLEGKRLTYSEAKSVAEEGFSSTGDKTATRSASGQLERLVQPELSSAAFMQAYGIIHDIASNALTRTHNRQ